MILRRKPPAAKIKKCNYTHPKEPRYADLNLAQKPSFATNSFKIISYNIKYSKKVDKAIRLLSENTELKSADIICLQEMTKEAVESIANDLKYNYVYYPAVLHPVLGRDFGNAILSRWPVIEDSKMIIPGATAKQSQRTAVFATVEIHGRPVVVCCVHFKVFLRASSRGAQMGKLLAAFPPATKYGVIAGDFNTFTKANNRAILEPIMNAAFIPATDGLGWSHKHWTLLNKKNQLDHIFIKGLDIFQTGKVVKHNKSSDHIPIWVELTFPKESFGENI